MPSSKKSAQESAETFQSAIESTAEETTSSAFAAADAWPDVARDNYETALKSFNGNAEKFRAQTEETIASAREGFQAANERMRAVGADAMAAAREEMTDAVDFANNLVRAKSVSDALEIQREYWTKLFETRVERARALTEASTEAAREAFAPFNRSFTPAFSFTPSFDKFFPFGTK